MNPPDQTDLPEGLLAHEMIELTAYRQCDPDLQDDIRRFIQACLRVQRARRSNPSNVVKFPKRRA